MATPEEAMDTGAMIAKEAAQALMVDEVVENVRIMVEIPKSVCMPRPKKDKQPTVPVHMSP